MRELSMEDPMLNIRVLKVPEFSFTLFINVIVTMALFGGCYFTDLPSKHSRFSPVDSGLLLLPGSLIMGITGPIAGRLFDRFGIRPLAIFGLTLMTYGTWELTQLNMDTSYYSIMGIYMLRSFGMAFIMMPIMTAGMNAFTDEDDPARKRDTKHTSSSRRLHRNGNSRHRHDPSNDGSLGRRRESVYDARPDAFATFKRSWTTAG